MRHRQTAATAVVLAVLLSGCGAGNAGGDTTCESYLEMNVDEQTDVVRAWLKDKGDPEANGSTVTINRLSALAFCNTMGRPSDPISRIDG